MADPKPADTTMDAQEAKELSPATRAANIPIVLESVLKNLPTKEILFARTVSRVFNEVIQDSALLKKALFLSPRKPHPERAMQRYRQILTFNTPPIYPRRIRIPTFDLGDSRTLDGYIGFSVNVGSKEGIVTCNSQFWELPPERQKGVVPHYPDSSWRKMLACQPPMFKIRATLDAVVFAVYEEREEGMDMSNEEPPEYGEDKKVVEFAPDTRLGEIVDFFEETLVKIAERYRERRIARGGKRKRSEALIDDLED